MYGKKDHSSSGETAVGANDSVEFAAPVCDVWRHSTCTVPVQGQSCHFVADEWHRNDRIPGGGQGADSRVSGFQFRLHFSCFRHFIRSQSWGLFCRPGRIYHVRSILYCCFATCPGGRNALDRRDLPAGRDGGDRCHHRPGTGASRNRYGRTHWQIDRTVENPLRNGCDCFHVYIGSDNLGIDSAARFSGGHSHSHRSGGRLSVFNGHGNRGFCEYRSGALV